MVTRIGIMTVALFCCASGVSYSQPADVPTVNASAVIVTGNTYQTILAATASPNDTSRRSLTIQNNNTNNDNCWIIFGQGITAANATKGKSILLGPGGSFQRYYPYMPSDEIEATCATSSDTIYVDRQ